MDYTIFNKHEIESGGKIAGNPSWDLFLSAFTSAERVTKIFDLAEAKNKLWLVLPQYGYEESELPYENAFVSEANDESEYIDDFFKSMTQGIDLEKISLCIDITGFIRPYLVYLIKWLQMKGVKKYDVLYSEPNKYIDRDNTIFSGQDVVEIRQIRGFEGNHSPDQTNDVLIINSGYEEHLIYKCAEYKDQANKIQLIGFPSLRADMYQENILRVKGAEEAIGHSAGSETNTLLAPANDPFLTAQVIKDKIDRLKNQRKLTNLYLCPLATKPQLLGMTIYYLYEWQNKNCSIIYPFSGTYSKQTSVGISRIWHYKVELP